MSSFLRSMHAVAAAASDRIMNLGRSGSSSKGSCNSDGEKEGHVRTAHDDKHHAAANGSSTTTAQPLPNASLSSDKQTHCEQRQHPAAASSTLSSSPTISADVTATVTSPPRAEKKLSVKQRMRRMKEEREREDAIAAMAAAAVAQPTRVNQLNDAAHAEVNAISAPASSQSFISSTPLLASLHAIHPLDRIPEFIEIRQNETARPVKCDEQNDSATTASSSSPSSSPFIIPLRDVIGEVWFGRHSSGNSADGRHVHHVQFRLGMGDEGKTTCATISRSHHSQSGNSSLKLEKMISRIHARIFWAKRKSQPQHGDDDAHTQQRDVANDRNVSESDEYVWYISDQRSTNGLFLNGIRLPSSPYVASPLHSGDHITFGGGIGIGEGTFMSKDELDRATPGGRAITYRFRAKTNVNVSEMQKDDDSASQQQRPQSKKRKSSERTTAVDTNGQADGKDDGDADGDSQRRSAKRPTLSSLSSSSISHPLSDNHGTHEHVEVNAAVEPNNHPSSDQGATQSLGFDSDLAPSPSSSLVVASTQDYTDINRDSERERVAEMETQDFGSASLQPSMPPSLEATQDGSAFMDGH